MSFTFKVRAKDGSLSVEEDGSGHVLDGVYSISGHRDERWETLSVGLLDDNKSTTFGATAIRTFAQQ